MDTKYKVGDIVRVVVGGYGLPATEVPFFQSADVIAIEPAREEEGYPERVVLMGSHTQTYSVSVDGVVLVKSL
tara:strand:- start:5801 stop:6019 length:219 start_codon:yes stop_codon:yes gene_type:complete